MAAAVATARTVKCVITGKPIPYIGYGRPPKYHPDAKKQLAAQRRQAAKDAKAAKPKTAKSRRSKKAA